MKQILQNLKSGETVLTDVPCPRVKAHHLLIRTTTSLVSSGTERMLVEFGKANIIEKARQQPDKVRMVIDKVKTDGLVPTLEAVRDKLDQPLPMGYCNVGVVLEVGRGVSGFSVGDRVASNGKHAEVVCVPVNLCTKVPDAVDDEAAAFTVIGAIALQGIRLAGPTLGETFVVTGLGLIGLMAVQLLRANGCRVLGIDLDKHKLELARGFGAETVDLARGDDPVAVAMAVSRGRGVDAVLITASTSSSEPVHQAALMCRKRGRIVLVGVTGLELSRADFYEKELSFQVSCSYGPGRYDPLYEEGGKDYPVGFVRWTEQRNFEAVLDMFADARLDARPLVSHRFELDQAESAYRLVGDSESLGVLLRYAAVAERPESELLQKKVHLAAPRGDARVGRDDVVVGFLGSGNYAYRVLIPAVKRTGAQLNSIASATGVTGTHAGRKYGFAETTTDTAAVLEDERVNVIVVATRHDSHARFVVRALEAGKHVFVEKPLCLTMEELASIGAAVSEHSNTLLMVGFNRRFAPQVVRMKELLSTVGGPKSMVMTVNAGAIPREHWTQDPEVGGGRIVGEACHFIDLLRCLADSPVQGYTKAEMEQTPGDTVSLQLSFANGSIGSIHYFANGNKAFPKERLEVFAGGRILQLDNFRSLTGFGWPGFRKLNLWRQDKGQNACVEAFINAIRSGTEAPVPYNQIEEVSRLSILLARPASDNTPGLAVGRSIG